MKGWGITLMVMGALAAVVAMFLGHTVVTTLPDYSLTSITGTISTSTSEVANISKIQTQSLVFGTGAVLFLAGAIFVAGGAIAEQLAALAPPLVAEAPHAPAPSTPVPETPPVPELSPEEQEARARRDNIVLWSMIGLVVAVFAVMLVITAFNSPRQPAASDNISSDEANAAAYESAIDDGGDGRGRKGHRRDKSEKR